MNTITEHPDPDRPLTHVLLVCDCGTSCPKNANRAAKFLDRHPRVCNARLADVEEKREFSKQLAEGTRSVDADAPMVVYDDWIGDEKLKPLGYVPASLTGPRAILPGGNKAPLPLSMPTPSIALPIADLGDTPRPATWRRGRRAEFAGLSGLPKGEQ